MILSFPFDFWPGSWLGEMHLHHHRSDSDSLRGAVYVCVCLCISARVWLQAKRLPKEADQKLAKSLICDTSSFTFFPWCNTRPSAFLHKLNDVFQRHTMRLALPRYRTTIGNRSTFTLAIAIMNLGKERLDRKRFFVQIAAQGTVDSSVKASNAHVTWPCRRG